MKNVLDPSLCLNSFAAKPACIGWLSTAVFLQLSETAHRASLDACDA
jgi:hypothetical protein